MYRAQVVGEDFEHGGGADGTGVQDLLTENRQHRQDTLEGRTRAAGEYRDVAGGGAVAAAGHGAIHRRGAPFLDPRGQAPGLGVISSAHFEPDLAGSEAGENTVGLLHDLRRNGRRGQAGDHQIDARGELPGGVRWLCATGDERRHALRIQVPHRQLDPVAQQVAGELAADIAQADEADAQVTHVKAPGARAGRSRRRLPTQASAYKYSTKDATAPSSPCTLGLVESIR